MSLSVDRCLIAEAITTVTERKRGTIRRVIRNIGIAGYIHISVKPYSAKDRRREVRSARVGKDQKIRI